ncbi:MAG: MFS transporter [Pseudomonadales bacterium]
MPLSFFERFPALAYPLYRRFWLASFASVGGTQLINLGQGWLIFEMTHSAWLLGVLGAAASIPNILMTLGGGVIADRVDRRQILRLTSSASAVLLAILAWLDWSNQIAVWHVLTTATLFSLITGLDWPARVSLYPRLIDRSAVMSAVALNAFVWQTSRLAIPAAGGLLIAATETAAVFTLGCLGFIAMFWVATTLPAQPAEPTPGPALHDLREGISYIVREPLFRTLMSLTFVAMFFGQSYTQLMPIFSTLLDAGETGYGYLLSAGGLGSVIGTLLLGSVTRRERLGVMMLTAAALSALCIMLFAGMAATGSFAAAFAATLTAAALASGFNITSMTVLQLSVPDRLRGRVMGIHSMSFSLMPLGALLLGALADRFGATLAVVLSASVYLIATCTVSARNAFIRQLDGRTLRALE